MFTLIVSKCADIPAAKIQNEQDIFDQRKSGMESY